MYCYTEEYQASVAKMAADSAKSLAEIAAESKKRVAETKRVTDMVINAIAAMTKRAEEAQSSTEKSGESDVVDTPGRSVAYPAHLPEGPQNTYHGCVQQSNNSNVREHQGPCLEEAEVTDTSIVDEECNKSHVKKYEGCNVVNTSGSGAAHPAWSSGRPQTTYIMKDSTEQHTKMKKVNCYVCQQFGHLAKKCPDRQQPCSSEEAKVAGVRSQTDVTHTGEEARPVQQLSSLKVSGEEARPEHCFSYERTENSLTLKNVTALGPPNIAVQVCGVQETVKDVGVIQESRGGNLLSSGCKAPPGFAEMCSSTKVGISRMEAQTQIIVTNPHTLREDSNFVGAGNILPAALTALLIDGGTLSVVKEAEVCGGVVRHAELPEECVAEVGTRKCSTVTEDSMEEDNMPTRHATSLVVQDGVADTIRRMPPPTAPVEACDIVTLEVCDVAKAVVDRQCGKRCNGVRSGKRKKKKPDLKKLRSIVVRNSYFATSRSQRTSRRVGKFGKLPRRKTFAEDGRVTVYDGGSRCQLSGRGPQRVYSDSIFGKVSATTIKIEKNGSNEQKKMENENENLSDVGRTITCVDRNLQADDDNVSIASDSRIGSELKKFIATPPNKNVNVMKHRRQQLDCKGPADALPQRLRLINSSTVVGKLVYIND